MAHGHTHTHGPGDYQRAFAVGVGLNAAFVLLEGGAGWIAGSLALLADAGHNLADVLGLLLAWGAAWLAGIRPTPARTYGLRRVTIFAAWFSAILLLVSLGGIARESVIRLRHPAPVDGVIMLAVAGLGVAINTATALMFMSGRRHDLNVKGAFLHMAADAGVSLGVVVAGVIILATGRLWVDPVISLLIVAVVLVGTWGLLRDSTNLAIDAVPAGIRLDEVAQYLRTLPGIVDLHDLHVWALSTTQTALTVHLVSTRTTTDNAFLEDLAAALRERFGIAHTTVQIEHAGQDNHCVLDPCTGAVQAPQAPVPAPSQPPSGS